jgi:Domain of unknown function (DUF1707)
MTDRVPEPTNVGPIAGGHLRASDADRDQVATVLSTAYAEGRLTREEHDERVEQLMGAKTFDDLIPITRDLVPTDGAAPVSSSPARRGDFTIESAGATDAPDWHVAVFGGVTRTGRWRVRRRIHSMALFGGVDLDLHNAVFEAPTVVISGFWAFGGLDIKVPEGIEVRDQTVGIFGGTDVRDIGDPLPGAPTLIIKGASLFGGVSVRGPKPEKRKRR